jgi:putative membrane protein
MDGLSTQWSFSPGLTIFLLLLSLLYLAGVLTMRRRVQRLRQTPDGRDAQMPLRTRHIVLFYLGILLAAILLLTPINTIARTQLFLAHIAQLVLLTTVCTPLMLSACPANFLRPFIEAPGVRGLVRAVTRPLFASLVFNLTFLLWHTPLLLRLSIANSTLYNAQVLTIFAASFLNWWPLVGSVHELRKMSYPAQMAYAFFDGQPVDILAFVLVFTEVSVYPYYAIPAALGLSRIRPPVVRSCSSLASSISA